MPMDLNRVGTDFVLDFEVDVSHAQEQQLLHKLSSVAARCEVVRREAVSE